MTNPVENFTSENLNEKKYFPIKENISELNNNSYTEISGKQKKTLLTQKIKRDISIRDQIYDSLFSNIKKRQYKTYSIKIKSDLIEEVSVFIR